MNIDAIKQALSVKGSRFASLVYRNAQGELARHTILLGVDYSKAQAKDLARLLCLQPRLQGVERQACDELIESMKKPVGQNDAYTCQGVYETISQGLKIHKEKGEVHLMGFSIRKEVLEQGTPKKLVNSSDKTLAKNKLRYLGRLAKVRQFKLVAENIQSIRANGKTLEFS